MHINRPAFLLVLPILLFYGITAGADKAEVQEGMASFPGLKTLQMKNEDVTLYYKPEMSQVLSGKHPEIKRYNEAGIYISRSLRTQLLGAGKVYFTIDCDSGGSGDPGCTFLQEQNGNLKEIIHIQGLRFAFPCDGSIYVEGHNNTMFNVRKKFEWHNGTFVEVKQPYNYVGLNTTTRESIKAFSSQEYKQAIASLPKGSRVTVIANEGENYLVKTPFGLLGWVKIQVASQEKSPIIGIYFAGD